jgi:hypothetical protein
LNFTQGADPIQTNLDGSRFRKRAGYAGCWCWRTTPISGGKSAIRLKPADAIVRQYGGPIPTGAAAIAPVSPGETAPSSKWSVVLFAVRLGWIADFVNSPRKGRLSQSRFRRRQSLRGPNRFAEAKARCRPSPIPSTSVGEFFDPGTETHNRHGPCRCRRSRSAHSRLRLAACCRRWPR